MFSSALILALALTASARPSTVALVVVGERDASLAALESFLRARIFDAWGIDAQAQEPVPAKSGDVIVRITAPAPGEIAVSVEEGTKTITERTLLAKNDDSPAPMVWMLVKSTVSRALAPAPIVPEATASIAHPPAAPAAAAAAPEVAPSKPAPIVSYGPRGVWAVYALGGGNIGVVTEARPRMATALGIERTLFDWVTLAGELGYAFESYTDDDLTVHRVPITVFAGVSLNALTIGGAFTVDIQAAQSDRSRDSDPALGVSIGPRARWRMGLAAIEAGDFGLVLDSSVAFATRWSKFVTPTDRPVEESRVRAQLAAGVEWRWR
jgi:hypothetical protein